MPLAHHALRRSVIALAALLSACGADGAPPAGMNNAGGSSSAGGDTNAAMNGSAGHEMSASGGSERGRDSGGGNGGAAPVGAGERAKPSMGCNVPSMIEPGKFISSTVSDRRTWLRLPIDYDASRAYPIVFIWKGCNTPGLASYGMENWAGKDAIIVQVDFATGQNCYDTADNAAYVDLPVFDDVLAQLEKSYCADSAHVFSVGFSSGAWLTQLLGCQRGDVLRGIGTIAGAFKPAFLKGAPTCRGNGLSAFMVSDLSDTNNPFHDTDNDGDSVEVAVNHWLNTNGCTEKAWTMSAGTPAKPDESVCRAYSDCGPHPVELCLTTGKGHDAQQDLSMPGFWQMFQQSLPR